MDGKTNPRTPHGLLAADWCSELRTSLWVACYARGQLRSWDSSPLWLRLEPAWKLQLPSGSIFWYHISMKSARKNGTKKRRGRPATGRGLQIGTRWSDETVALIDAWAAAQDDEPGRSV